MADGDVTLRYNLVGRDQGANKAFKELGQNVEHLHGKMTAVGVAIGNLASSGIMALGHMAVSAVSSGLQTAAGLQQAQLGFTTMLGSAQKAQTFIGQLAQFAAATPFEMPGLVDASRTLLGVGVAAKDVIPELTAYGDAAGALGIQQDAFQRIMIAVSQSLSAGKIKLGDMNQLMNNGLPVWKLMSEAMHKPVPALQDMISKGKLLSADVLPKLQAQMEKDYGGSMAKQSQTLAGLWSTAMDTFHLGMARVLMPLIPILQKYLPGAMATMGSAFAGAATAVQGFISGGGLTTMAHIITHDVVPALKFIGDHKDVFAALAASAATGIATYKTYTLVMGIFTAITTAAAVAQKLYAVATREATVAQVGLDVAMDANPIGLIVAAIAALVVGLIALGVWLYSIASHSETFRNAMSAAFNAVKGVVVAAVNAIKAAWDAFVGGFQNPEATIGKSVGTVTAIFLTLGATVGKVVGWFRALPGEIAGAWATATGAWVTATGVLQAGLSAVVGWFQALPGRVLAGIEAFPQAFANFCLRLLEMAAFAVGFGLGMLVNLFVIWPFRVGQAIATLPGIVWQWITTTGVRGAIAVASFLADWARRIWQWIADFAGFMARLPGIVGTWIAATSVRGAIAFVQFHEMLVAKAYALTAALIAWAASTIPRVVGWFERLPGMAVDAISALPGLIKGVFSAAGTWLISAGKAIVSGLINGIKAAFSDVWSLVKDLGGQVVSGFKSALGIGSPSKVMAEQVGKWIPPGLVMGINQSMPSVYSALTIQPPAGLPSGGTVQSTGRGGGVTNIHLHVPNGFVGSPDQLATALSDVISRAKARGLNLSFA